MFTITVLARSHSDNSKKRGRWRRPVAVGARSGRAVAAVAGPYADGIGPV